MHEIIESVLGFLQLKSGALFRVVIVILGAVLTSRVFLHAIERGLTDRLNVPQIKIGRVFATYLVYAIAVAWSLQLLGFDPGVLLGAAGVVTVAIGFASQTSVSNIISGLFLLAEQPFVVGDIIKIEETVGEVLSIDLLSVKIRTFDNLYVRMPNETMLKSKLITLTKFPIRRVDIEIRVAYDADLALVQSVFESIAEANTMVMEEPKPQFILKGFGDYFLNLQLSVWGRREDRLDLSNGIQKAVVEAFQEHGIEIPYPQRMLHTADRVAVKSSNPASPKSVPDSSTEETRAPQPS